MRCKKKVTSTEYDEELKKPLLEVTEESEEVCELKGRIDIDMLKTATGLLKEVLEMSEESEIESTDRSVIVLADVKDFKNGE